MGGPLPPHRAFFLPWVFLPPSIYSAGCRIAEMLVARPSGDGVHPPACSRTGTRTWVRWGFVWLKLGNLQGWKLHDLSGQPIPVLRCSPRKTGCPAAWPEAPKLVCGHCPCPIICSYQEAFGFIFVTVLHIKSGRY